MPDRLSSGSVSPLSGPAPRDPSPAPRTSDLLLRPVQRRVDALWERLASGRGEVRLVDGAVRPDIIDSWRRCRDLEVAGALPRAPRTMGPGDLHQARSACDWLPLVPDVVRGQRDVFLGGRYVLAVFDEGGRMLAADGDPGTLEGLAEINFAPGGLWTESAAGTNGPGTALATGAAVEVVGTEHWCVGWKRWHCAAAPVRDPATGRVVGVLDLSGPVDAALPHALPVVRALALAVEERLAARAARDRSRALTRWADLVSSYPGDGVLALGAGGQVVARSGAWVPLLEGAERGEAGRRLVEALAELGAGDGGDLDLVHELIPGTRAAVHTVRDGGRTVATCLVLPGGGGAVAPSRATTSDPAASPPPARVSPGGGAGPGGQVRYTLDDLLGASPAIQEVRRVARACARTDLPVLLVGASGTGKEVLAQGIHAAGPRRDGPFVAVNCGALPRELVAAELFGYTDGAFSGARAGGARGTFDAADGGTLLLDEVGDLPLDAQATLLRTLEEGIVRPVGATGGHRVDVRIMAATNRDLSAAIAQGTFRADLYHRLAVLSIATPTLAGRREDIAGLALHFLERENRTRTVPRRFTPAALAALRSWEWPGNVRELLNLVRRLVALSESAEIGVEDLPPLLRASAGGAGAAGWGVCDGTGGPRGSGAGFEVSADGAAHAPAARRTGAAAESDADTSGERAALARVIATQPTMVAAAEALGVSRSTLYRRMDRLGLRPGRSARFGRRGGEGAAAPRPQ